jgi:Mlc titration factor MtfA (ptsG expression regulator)
MTAAAGWWRRWVLRLPDIAEALWQDTLHNHPFVLTALQEGSAQPGETQARLATLRGLCERFLRDKEFHGAHGLQVDDRMALAIALQACLPLVWWGPRGLRLYSDFVGIVVQPAAALARRQTVDSAGVVHEWREPLAGEAMHGGPVMLSWAHVQQAAHDAGLGHNLVIHEFAHKIDMHGKPLGSDADGRPWLGDGFMGLPSASAAMRHWREVFGSEYERFRQAVAMAERFGAPRPWLDAYGAEAPGEFFAVACEAYFAQPAPFRSEWPALAALFDAYFRQPLRV